MQTRSWRPIALAASLATFIALADGCSQADNPKLAEAPAFTTPPDTTPPKIPTRKQGPAYGSSSKYQEAMQRAANAGR
jgi:hypothetical protein